MRIEKIIDNNPSLYIIHGGWGGTISASLEDLEDLAFEIERILKEEKAKSMLQVVVEVVME